MNKIQFWRIESPESTAKLAEWAHEEMRLEGVICPIYDGHQRGGKRLTDLSITLPGQNVQDFVWTWQSECLLTERVLDLFRSNDFTGFEVKPVKAKFKKTDDKPPELWELVVTGWAGMAPLESGIKLIKHCSACGSLKYSGCTNPEKLIVPSQWDGSDFFMVWPLPRFIFVTERVAGIIRENKLTGAVLKLPTELSFSGSGFSPGRLSYWMSEQRAKELGEAMGIV